MTPALRVVRAGLQTTVQAGARRGSRHLGVPACGAFDPVSLALANRLVGNPPAAPGLETTMTGAAFAALRPVRVAVVGAPCRLTVNGTEAAAHETFTLSQGDVLDIGRAGSGCRTYLAVAGGIGADEAFGSVSTYLPGGFGGVGGRALREGDELSAPGGTDDEAAASTPARFRLPFTGAWTLRAVPGPEADALPPGALDALFGEGWRASRDASRMGVRLRGPSLAAPGDARMDSVAVLPGTVQLPPGGAPIILGVDGGTTGGYPRVAQVIRADRHLIGQVAPSESVRLLRWGAEDAGAVLGAKLALLRGYVGTDFTF